MQLTYIKKITSYCVLGLFSILCGNLTATASSGDNSLQVIIPDTIATAGADLSIPLIVQDSTDAYSIISYDIVIEYDSTIFSVERAEVSGTLSSGFVVLTNEARPGSLVVSGMDFGSAMTGRGPLLYLEGHVKDSAMGRTPLHFHSLQFNGGNPVAEPVDGMLSVRNAPPATFEILEPAENVTIVIDRSTLNNTVQLAWQSTQDIEGDSIQYGLYLETDNTSVLPFRNNNGNKADIDYATIADLIRENSTGEIEGKWSIYATDGLDTTFASNGPRNLRVDFTTAVEQPSQSLPDNYSLEQNFPNPFNPTTTIEYRIPKTASVRITVFDATGRTVKQLIDNDVAAGRHFTSWDGINENGVTMPAGVYFYRLKTADYSVTKKMMLIK